MKVVKVATVRGLTHLGSLLLFIVLLLVYVSTVSCGATNMTIIKKMELQCFRVENILNAFQLFWMKVLLLPATFSTSALNDLLAKCVYSAFSHYYPQYDPCTKGLMAESFPPACLQGKIIDRMCEQTGTRSPSCFPKRGDIMQPGWPFLTKIVWLLPAQENKKEKRDGWESNAVFLNHTSDHMALSYNNRQMQKRRLEGSQSQNMICYKLLCPNVRLLLRQEVILYQKLDSLAWLMVYFFRRKKKATTGPCTD